MNENLASQNSAVEINDSLEAVSVFRNWKNVFFGVLLVCLLLSQAAFWLINVGLIEAPATLEPVMGSGGALATGAGTTVASADAAPPASRGLVARLFGGIDFERTARGVELLNGILIVTAVLLAASIFFGLLVSLVGRLGGLNHISRAFILALIAVVLLVPWQLFGQNVLGVTWTPEELARWLPTKSASLWNTIIFYLRFTGYWAAITLLVLLSQARTTRWSKSILQRLEII
ncbi:MAG: hypothetical protein FJ280_04775 [Planctomycetes bacterium]|nr:hypothetical protein [Planctomycetota bacterium]